MKKIIILIVAQVIILGGALGAAWYLFKGPDHSAPDTGEAVAEEAAAKADAKTPAKASAKTPAKVAVPVKDPLYRSLEPAFVVNLADGPSVRFLQVQVDMMTREEAVIPKLEKYDFRIRNDLIMLFSSMTRNDIADTKGRLKLQADAVATINRVLAEETGSGSVEAVYFTKFVIQ